MRTGAFLVDDVGGVDGGLEVDAGEAAEVGVGDGVEMLAGRGGRNRGERTGGGGTQRSDGYRGGDQDQGEHCGYGDGAAGEGVGHGRGLSAGWSCLSEEQERTNAVACCHRPLLRVQAEWFQVERSERSKLGIVERPTVA
jgi:hypothetical protein